MEFSSPSLRRLAYQPLSLQLPSSLTNLPTPTGRTPYPDLDPPQIRLKSYDRKDLSTERSLTSEPSQLPKKQFYPRPKGFGTELSIGELSRKGTEEIDGSLDSPENQAEDEAPGFEEGEQAELSEKETVKQIGFRKFQSQSNLPPAFLGHYVPKTEAEVRMEARFISGQNRDLKLKNEQKQLLQRMQEYNHTKGRIIKNAMQKVQLRKAFNKTKLRNDEYSCTYQAKRKLSTTIDSPRRKQSSSLPSLKIIDTTKQYPPIEVNAQQHHQQKSLSRQEDAARLRETLTEILHLSGESRNQAFLHKLLSDSLSSTKFYFKKDAQKQDFEQGMEMMERVQHLFRRKGLPVDMNALKKALVEQKRQPADLTKFPELNLISNPYYRRWGL